MVSDRPILEMRDVSIEVGGRRVLTDVSFSVSPGRCVGLVGETGSGKSMACRVVTGLLERIGAKPVAGNATYLRRNILTLSQAEWRKLRGRDIALVPQSSLSGLSPVRRVGSQLEEAVGLLDPKANRRARALELLDQVHLRQGTDLLRRYPHELSGGMRQRVMIALALAGRPRLLVADEPTTALDVTVQRGVLRLLDEIRVENGLALIFVSHDLAVVESMAQDILVMYGGRIVESGTAQMVLEDPRHPYTRALLDAREVDPASGRYATIRSYNVNAASSSAGCSFAPRCWLAKPECIEVIPTLDEVSSGHRAACIRSDQTGALLRQPVHRSGNEPLPSASTPTVAPKQETPEGGEPPLMDVRGVTVLFAKDAPPAVADVTLQIVPGSATGIVGESGSGKTTLARLLVGALQPTIGEVLASGRPWASVARADPVRRSVQMVFQDPYGALNPYRTARETVAEVLSTWGISSRREAGARAAAVLAEVGLTPRSIDRRPTRLSGGECQRVGIARALACDPSVLVADEPTSSLDVSVQGQILNLLNSLRETRGLALVLISHDLAVVSHVTDEVLVMFEGRVIERGPTQEVFAQPREDYTRLLIDSILGRDGLTGPSPASFGGASGATSTSR
jgi:peptide/nickel transport system ATP-binding protein